MRKLVLSRIFLNNEKQISLDITKFSGQIAEGTQSVPHDTIAIISYAGALKS
jgi:hypothetical protein